MMKIDELIEKCRLTEVYDEITKMAKTEEGRVQGDKSRVHQTPF
jgi:hypothetical protein